MRPYRTLDNKIEGAVIAFVDMDMRRHDGQTAERAERVSQPRKSSAAVQKSQNREAILAPGG
ncbi:MAG: hypothetical protein DMF03_02325 [Verrucomicrobia bacterium]|nr:MAG: hypothetical protein DMF03_02325 [Verrucomicrobiota bacterium]